MTDLFATICQRQENPLLSPHPYRQSGYALLLDHHTGATEVEIVGAYQKWGTNAARYLSGDYAFILWDEKNHLLIAARSITGRCPLYFVQTSSSFFCASDPTNPTLLHQGISWDRRWLALWLICNVDYWRFSPWQGISPLLPGHTLVYEQLKGRLQIQATWFPPKRLSVKDISFEDAGKQFRSLLRNALKTRLQSKRNISFDCSGGLDSSSIVAVVANLEIDLEKIHIYHGFSSEYQEEDARQYILDLINCYPAIPVIPHWINFDDLRKKPLRIVKSVYPFLQSVMFPAYPQEIVRQMDLQGSTAHFNGIYGDQLMVSTTTKELLQQHIWQLPFDLREWQQWQAPLPLLYQAFLKYRSSKQLSRVPTWISPEGVNLAQKVLLEQEGMMKSWIYDPFQRGMLVTMLHDQQMLTRYFSNERQHFFPFLDQNLIEFFCSCPLPWLMAPGPGRKKGLLREAMRGFLPESIRQRRDKGNATRIIAAWSRSQSEAIKVLASSLSVPFVEQKELITAINRMGYGDCRDQRFVFHTLALATHRTEGG